ncbi:MAG: cyclic nucleotide-binding domain-containing protein [Pseudomonadota bacterium]
MGESLIGLLPNAALLVHMASLLYVIAFLVKDQLWLRGLVLVATICYIAYYYFVPETPLWDAIWWSLVLGAANVFVTFQIVLERTTFNMPDEQKALYEKFNTLSPGEFRRLMKCADWNSSSGTRQLTTENEPLDCLHFVISGTITVAKDDRSFVIPPNTFIGEVAYFLKTPASATVTVGDQSRVVTWKREDLAQLERKNPGIRIGLHGLLSSDMAIKVAAS